MRQLKNVTCVIPVYNEGQVLPSLLTVLPPILHKLQVSCEIIVVDDGSTDQTSRILTEHQAHLPELTVVTLSRNFGQQAALAAGLTCSRGDVTILLDADLQDDPGAIVEFIDQWRRGVDVVYAVREKRKEPWWLRTCYTVFYKVLSIVAESNIPQHAGDFCLMDQRVVEQLRTMPEYHKFLRGMRSWLGFCQIGIPVVRNPRVYGSPKYTLRKLLRLAFDGFFSFSVLPLRLISIMGVCFALMGIALAGYFAIQKFLFGLSPPGFATLVILTSFFSGVQMIMLGVVGEYVGRILEQVRGRPPYVISSIARGTSRTVNA